MLVTKIKDLCKTHSITISTLEKECELTLGSIRYWDNSPPSYDKVMAVARYFNLSIDELCDDYSNCLKLNNYELFIIKTFRTAKDFEKGRIYGYVESLSERY